MTPQEQKQENKKRRTAAKKRKQSAEKLGKWVRPILIIGTIARWMAFLAIILLLAVGTLTTARWILEAMK